MYDAVSKGTLPPDMYGPFPLDQSQYPRLFSSTRIPRRTKDELKSFPNSKHILVLRGSQMYRLDVIDAAGNPRSEAAIAFALKQILASAPPSGLPVAALSTMGRDAWADTRSALLLDEQNRVAMEAVDGAIIALTLDDAAPTSMPAMSRVMLHGNGDNRWYDKSVNLIVTANGTAAVNFEHSWGDGICVLRYCNEIWRESVKNPAAAPADGGLRAAPIKFNISDQISATIGSALKTLRAQCGALECDVSDLNGFGKEDLKALRVRLSRA